MLDSVRAETTQTLDRPRARALLDDEPETQVLDVREETEHERGEAPGRGRAARSASFASLPPPELDPDRPVYTICASGPRATLAASLLAPLGFDARPTLGGGVADLVRERARLVESR